MTDFDVFFGSPGNMTSHQVSVDRVKISHLDGAGTRRLEAYNEDQPGVEHQTETVYSVTVGPGAVLGYERHHEEA